MAGLWIVGIDVTDPDEYGKYLEGSAAAVSAHGGEYIARAGRYTSKEGRDYPRNVVVRFASYERALEAYESEQYQSALAHALAGSERFFTIVETSD